MPPTPLPLATGLPLKDAIVREARALGFDLVGVGPAGGWPSAERFPAWLAEGYAGEMTYLAEEPALRGDARLRFPWAKSAVMVAASYRTDDPCLPAERRPFSRYAWGSDYHDLLLKRLKRLKEACIRLGGGPDAHYDLDTGPVLERAAAAGAGLGWLAKNAMLIHERAGSYVFLGAVFVPYDLPHDPPAPSRCGTCARCLPACPTQAFVAPYVLDARRCISYLTIELRGPIPRDLREPMGELVFGCDICQEVCPWNARAARREPVTADPRFRPRPRLASDALEDLLSLVTQDEATFRARFRQSPVLRVKRHGLARNACVALGNRGDPAALPALTGALSADPHPLVRSHAAWAVGRLLARGDGPPAPAPPSTDAASLAPREPQAPEVRRGALAALRNAASADPDLSVRQEAAQALADLGRRA